MDDAVWPTTVHYGDDAVWTTGWDRGPVSHPQRRLSPPTFPSACPYHLPLPRSNLTHRLPDNTHEQPATAVCRCACLPVLPAVLPDLFLPARITGQPAIHLPSPRLLPPDADPPTRTAYPAWSTFDVIARCERRFVIDRFDTLNAAWLTHDARARGLLLTTRA